MINFFKGQPTQYILKYVGGQVKREGAGISFLYWKPVTTIAVIPITTLDANFIFNEITQTFQEVTIQGQLTYRIADPKKVAGILDFSIEPRLQKYLSQDPDKLMRRIINSLQMVTRAEIQKYSLEDVLRNSEKISKTISVKVKEDNVLNELGIECISIHFATIKPTPELAKALEAEYREMIQKKADQAIYSRRAAAVEQERKIKENELESSIALEKSRRELVELNGSNLIKESEYKAKSVDIELQSFKNVDPRLLLSLGLKSLGENAERIEHLTITPELLGDLLRHQENPKKS